MGARALEAIERWADFCSHVKVVGDPVVTEVMTRSWPNPSVAADAGKVRLGAYAPTLPAADGSKIRPAA